MIDLPPVDLSDPQSSVVIGYVVTLLTNAITWLIAKARPFVEDRVSPTPEQIAKAQRLRDRFLPIITYAAAFLLVATYNGTASSGEALSWSTLVVSLGAAWASMRQYSGVKAWFGKAVKETHLEASTGGPEQNGSPGQ